VHLSALGHPIVGDRTYGGGGHADRLTDLRTREALQAFRGLALHARSLEFAHPRTGERRAYEATRPPAFAALLEALSAIRGGGPILKEGGR
ncbi:MAG: RNA pseudouridine synthase, partial [bacterium]